MNRMEKIEPIDKEFRTLQNENESLKRRIRNHYWFSTGLLIACILLLGLLYW